MASRNPYPTAAPFLPKTRSLRALRTAAQSCEGCDLHAHATQTVFGEGPAHGRVVLVGEQPGDQEDRAGRPFVGPAGALLDLALAHAGIPRDDVYVTNAVKHFKYTQRRKRRIHDKPTYYQVQACKPWLDEELAALEPEVVVLLGATAAQAIFGRGFKVTQHRGELMTIPTRSLISAPDAFRAGPASASASDIARVVICTVHPASVLRAPDDDTRAEAREAFMRDFDAVGDAYRRTLRSHAGEAHAST